MLWSLKWQPPGKRIKRPFTFLSKFPLHGNERTNWTSECADAFFICIFLVSFQKKHGKRRSLPLSPAFSSLCKHSRLEAFKQTTNRWFVTMTRDGMGCDWSWDFYSAFAHTLKKNGNAKSGAFHAVITPVPPLLIVSFIAGEAKTNSTRFWMGFEVLLLFYFIFSNFPRSKEFSPSRDFFVSHF